LVRTNRDILMEIAYPRKGIFLTEWLSGTTHQVARACTNICGLWYYAILQRRWIVQSFDYSIDLKNVEYKAAITTRSRIRGLVRQGIRVTYHLTFFDFVRSSLFSKVHVEFSRDRDATRVVSGSEKDYRLVCSG
jgi:hypothetical protein